MAKNDVSAKILLEEAANDPDLDAEKAAVALMRAAMMAILSDPRKASLDGIGSVLDGVARVRSAGPGGGDGNVRDEVRRFMENKDE